MSVQKSIKTLRQNVSKYRIVWFGMAAFVLLSLGGIFLERAEHPQISLKDAFLPPERDIALIRIIGASTAVVFMLFGQAAYSRLLHIRTRLEAEERWHRKLIEISPDPLVVCDVDSTIRMANHRAAALLGRGSSNDLVGQKALKFVALDDFRRIVHLVSSVLDQGTLENMSCRLVGKEGRLILAELSASAIVDQDQKASGLIVVCRDVTERLAMENALREGEAMYRSILETSSDAIAVMDARFRVQMVNEQALQLYGAQLREEMIGRNAMEFIAPEDLARAQEELTSFLTQGWPQFSSYRMVRKDGSRVKVETSSSVVRHQDGTIKASIGIIRDVTDRDRLEREVLEISEREKHRIGMDLHDSICSELAGIAYMAESVSGRLNRERHEVAESAQTVSSLIRHVVSEARIMAHGLSPVGMHPGDLITAMEALAESTEKRSGVKCRFAVEGTLEEMDAAMATHLYRIAQEAVNNAVQHGRPQRVALRLLVRDHHASFQVEDDGVGIVDPPHRQKGTGIGIINYRCGVYGGHMQIERLPRGGTLLSCHLPLPQGAGRGYGSLC